MKNIPVVLISSDEFAPYCAAAIISAAKNCSLKKRLKFFIISDNISKQNRKLLKKNGASVKFIDIDKKLLEPFQKIKIPKHVSILTYARILVPNLLPEYDKIIFLDSDMLILGDISELFKTDLGENYLGMVEDAANLKHAQKLFENGFSTYYNAGTILFNAKKMREDNYLNLVYEKITKNAGKYTLCDQDILNDTFFDKILRLDVKWNFYHKLLFSKLDFFKPANVTEYELACNNPAIVHFVGPNKPWLENNAHKYKQEWQKYFNLTPFAPGFRKRRKFLQKIFSVRNEQYYYKVWTILGVKLKFTNKKRKQKLLQDRLFNEISFLKTNFAEQKKQIRALNLNLADEKKQIAALSAALVNQAANIQCTVWANAIHPLTFGKYRNAFENKDVVLLCTGPSAKYYKPLENVINVGVNGAIYFENILLDYYFIQDNTILQPNNAKLNIDANNYTGNNCQKFYGILSSERIKQIEKNSPVRKLPPAYSNGENVNNYILEAFPRNNFAYDLSIEPVGDWCGVPFSAMQFILWGNPKRIYLVGCDCSSGYFYKKESISNMDYQIESWEKLKAFVDIHYPDTEIISINPVGLKGLFKDVYTDGKPFELLT